MFIQYLGKRKSMRTCPLAERMNPVLAVTIMIRSWSAVPKMIRLLCLTLLDSFKLMTRCEGESSTICNRSISSRVRCFSPLPPILSTSAWKSLKAPRQVTNSLPSKRASRFDLAGFSRSHLAYIRKKKKIDAFPSTSHRVIFEKT